MIMIMKDSTEKITLRDTCIEREMRAYFSEKYNYIKYICKYTFWLRCAVAR